jgi:hypothetical protein
MTCTVWRSRFGFGSIQRRFARFLWIWFRSFDDWSAVVCISSTIEAEELHAILLGYPGLKLTIARPALQDDPLVSEIGEKGNLWSVRMVPVRTQGSISSRRVIIQQCSGNAPTLKRAAVKATTVTAPAPTVVIRLSTEKRYKLLQMLSKSSWANQGKWPVYGFTTWVAVSSQVKFQIAGVFALKTRVKAFVA